MFGSGQIDEKGAGEAGVGDSRADDHLYPDNEQLRAGQQKRGSKDPGNKADTDSEEQKNKKGCQGEMPSPKGSRPEINIVIGSEKAYSDSQKEADEWGPHPDESNFPVFGRNLHIR
jgi:hypothetical protein